MTRRVSFMTTGLTVGLLAFAGRLDAQQTAAPPASRDTSRAAKVRTDTVAPSDSASADVRGYRASTAVPPCAAPGAAAAGIASPNAALPATRSDSSVAATGVAGDSAQVRVESDSVAAIRSAQAAGVYHAPAPAATASARTGCDSARAGSARAATPARDKSANGKAAGSKPAPGVGVEAGPDVKAPTDTLARPSTGTTGTSATPASPATTRP